MDIDQVMSPYSGKNHMLADIVAIIGTLDVVFGVIGGGLPDVILDP